MIEIQTRNRDFLIAVKPPLVPSQPDPTGDADMMTLLRAQLAAEGESDTLYLIHRLDRTVGGLMVFARTPRAAAQLSAAVAERALTKEYFAIVEGDLSDDGGTLRDLLFKDSGKGRSFVVARPRAGVKEAILHYTVLARRAGHTLVCVRLETGRFHQIRAQFSSRGTPLVCDRKYGSRDRGGGIALYACRLDFSYRDRAVSAFALPNLLAYPWSLFSPSEYAPRTPKANKSQDNMSESDEK